MLSNVLDHSCELYSVLVVEKFWQRHGPVEPGIEDVGFLGVVGGDQVVHGRNVAARSDFDLLARFDREWRQRVRFGANLVSGDGADGVHQPGVISEAENFLPGGGDSEFAIILDEGRAAQESQGSLKQCSSGGWSGLRRKMFYPCACSLPNPMKREFGKPQCCQSR